MLQMKAKDVSGHLAAVTEGHLVKKLGRYSICSCTCEKLDLFDAGFHLVLLVCSS